VFHMPAYPIHFVFITPTMFGEEHRWSCSWYNLLQPPDMPSLLRPGIFCRTLFSNNLRLSSPLIRQKKFHTLIKKTTGTIMVRHILITFSLYNKWEDKIYQTEW
jgi:hypothetical protein